ncbi:protein PLANT CADMIUM RESISTANCE 10 [Vigna radiata var. radiata]|uniref:Protein PLANT CADMIUM RESISTANCE 10 n=1 Tax=Vigna radiata var. radiata TaxID=3916 RepID=A0A1S3VNN0_VIGRR|nr:protein PLANT CADMIUM RESISTANCE 10 [Vigna radiata var. radiata]XP_014519994.1 protein PLANT CADMIUM RESISTANCE 10 [Vigna radiata var. radiata]
MKNQHGYVPPAYIPLGQSDSEVVHVSPLQRNEEHPGSNRPNQMQPQWSSGICACFDDTQSCCIGCLCPCILFGKNAEILGSGTFLGSCVTHFILWSVVNTACCLLTDGLFLGLPGCLVSCYACGYRKALRSKYNLPEAPCGDFVTHFCCHPCAICQEYREICERSGDSESTNLNLAVVTAPPIQTMQPDSKQ